MTHPTCAKCDCVAGCQARERLCPNFAQPDVTFIDEGDKAVMQQALDTLKRVDCVDRDRDILSLSLCEAVEQSIAALREAVAQPAIAHPVQQSKKLPPLPLAVSEAIDAHWRHGYGEGRNGINVGTTGKAIFAELIGAIRDYAREAVGQPVKPAADLELKLATSKAIATRLQSLLDARHALDEIKGRRLARQDRIPAIAQPVQKPLSDEDIEKCVEQVWGSFADFDDMRLFTRAIEATHNIAQPKEPK